MKQLLHELKIILNKLCKYILRGMGVCVCVGGWGGVGGLRLYLIELENTASG